MASNSERLKKKVAAKKDRRYGQSVINEQLHQMEAPEIHIELDPRKPGIDRKT